METVILLFYVLLYSKLSLTIFFPKASVLLYFPWSSWLEPWFAHQAYWPPEPQQENTSLGVCMLIRSLLAAASNAPLDRQFVILTEQNGKSRSRIDWDLLCAYFHLSTCHFKGTNSSGDVRSEPLLHSEMGFVFSFSALNWFSWHNKCHYKWDRSFIVKETAVYLLSKNHISHHITLDAVICCFVVEK